MAFSAKIVGDELVPRITMNATPEKSSTGKTLVVASTYGHKDTDCVVDGKTVIVGVNACIPTKERERPGSQRCLERRGGEVLGANP